MIRRMAAALLVFGTMTTMAATPKKRVYKVTSATATRSGNMVTVEAKGSVRTGGWTTPELVRIAGTSSTMTFRFVATPPDGMATQVITPIAAKKTVGPLRPPYPKKVKVLAETSSITVTIGRE